MSHFKKDILHTHSASVIMLWPSESTSWTMWMHEIDSNIIMLKMYKKKKKTELLNKTILYVKN